MILNGRVINSGQTTAIAVVLDVPFSFIGDFDPLTGKLQLPNHPANGMSIAGKVLVIPTGKGGTIAPWVAYNAAKKKMAPAAILSRIAEPITCESAITINIPMLCDFDKDPVCEIRTNQTIKIDGNVVEIQ